MRTADRRQQGGIDATAPSVRADRASGSVESGLPEALPIEDFLAAVGRRVRRQRALVHMSRRTLAERSGVSERYLAQLETGQGNMSIVLLRRVALALELPLPELVAEEDAESVSERLLVSAG